MDPLSLASTKVLTKAGSRVRFSLEKRVSRSHGENKVFSRRSAGQVGCSEGDIVISNRCSMSGNCTRAWVDREAQRWQKRKTRSDCLVPELGSVCRS